MGFRRRARRGYRKLWGHKSPYRRVFGSRSLGQAIGVSYRQTIGPAREIAKIAAEVRGLKARSNVEKKHKEEIMTGTGDEGYGIGQVAADTDGILTMDCTPEITQGIGHDQRVGNSLKLTGMAFAYQLNGMAYNQQRQRVRLTLVKVSSPDIASVNDNEVYQMMFDVNPLTGVRDINAPINYATLKQNGIKIIRSHTITLPASEAASTLEYTKVHKTSRFSVKLQDVVRFANASATIPEGHKYLMIAQADTGNSYTVNSTKTDIPIKQASSGSLLRMHVKYWWVDN